MNFGVEAGGRKSDLLDDEVGVEVREVMSSGIGFHYQGEREYGMLHSRETAESGREKAGWRKVGRKRMRVF